MINRFFTASSQERLTATPEWNTTIFNIISFTGTVPSLTSQKAFYPVRPPPTAVTKPEHEREHKVPQRIPGVHVLTNARRQRCGLVQQLAEGYSSAVSCYWAVNSADGSCLCVLIRSVTLNLGIDTWGDAERGRVAIYRPSIMTFIDDVTTGARGFETHTHRVRRGIESICLSFVHPNTHQAKGFPS